MASTGKEMDNKLGFFRARGISALVLALAISPAYGQVYKWQDSQGRVHYSDSPPKAHHSYREVTSELPHVHRMEPLRRGPMTSTYSSRPDTRTTPSARSRAVDGSYYHDLPSYRASQSQGHCDWYRAELDRIQKQLRGGYKENTGNRLSERRRELSENLYRECRDR